MVFVPSAEIAALAPTCKDCCAPSKRIAGTTICGTWERSWPMKSASF